MSISEHPFLSPVILCGQAGPTPCVSAPLGMRHGSGEGDSCPMNLIHCTRELSAPRGTSRRLPWAAPLKRGPSLQGTTPLLLGGSSPQAVSILVVQLLPGRSLIHLFDHSFRHSTTIPGMASLHLVCSGARSTIFSQRLKKC